MDIAPPPSAPWWISGWRRLILPALPLAYLVYLIGSVRQNAHGAAAIAGYVIVAAFAVAWMICIAIAPKGGPRFWVLYVALFALFVAALPFGHEAAFVMCVYITMLTVIRLGAWSALVVAALALGALFVPIAVSS
jgi:two-component system, NarL family, sensor histidine kinase DesK